MNTPTASLCADRENLDAATARLQPSEYNDCGLLVSLRFGGLTIQTHGDATPADLADTLDRLAADVRRLAEVELGKRWQRELACEGSDLPEAEVA